MLDIAKAKLTDALDFNSLFAERTEVALADPPSDAVPMEDVLAVELMAFGVLHLLPTNTAVAFGCDHREL